RIVASHDKAKDLLDVTTPLGENPLDVALRYQHDAASEALLAAGAAPHFATDAPPPLHDAARSDDVARAALLVGIGADAARLWSGKTALDIARENKSARVEALLRALASRSP